MSKNWNEALIIEQIKKIIYNNFSIDLADKPGSMNISELGLDSMGLLDVIMSIEDVIGQKINNVELPKNPTMSDVARMVMDNIKASNHG